MNALWLILPVWLTVATGVLLCFRRELVAVWQEPVLNSPVLIIESDDWGTGPVEAQTLALNRLVEVLAGHRDSAGRHPVMTLSLVLAVPDGPAIRRDGRYHRRLLDESLFAPVREAIVQGRNAGVFALQLHGLEHYWPAALMASTDMTVKAWLEADTPMMTERLPPHLQSRWVDASVLPSRPLDKAAVESAAEDEIALYRRIFRDSPRVAVPPTFVWTPLVEDAWFRRGVEFVVTPGLRSACRGADGLPQCDTGPYRNGQRGAGVTYLVRNDYFEPERGHQASAAMGALVSRTAQGRPCLLETHRSNFLGRHSGQAYAELDRLLEQALRDAPRMRFISTLELGLILRDRKGSLLETRLGERLAAWLERVKLLPRFWRLARLTGLAGLLHFLVLGRALR